LLINEEESFVSSWKVKITAQRSDTYELVNSNSSHSLSSPLDCCAFNETSLLFRNMLSKLHPSDLE